MLQERDPSIDDFRNELETKTGISDLAAQASKPSRPMDEATAATVNPAADHGDKAQETEARLDPPPASLEMKKSSAPAGMVTIDADTGPVVARSGPPNTPTPPADRGGGGGGGGGNGPVFHKRLGPIDFGASLKTGLAVVRKNLAIVMLFTIATNVLVLAIPDLSLPDIRPGSHQPFDRHAHHADGGDRWGCRASVDVRCDTALHPDAHGGGGCGATRCANLERCSQGFAHSNGSDYQTLGDLQQLRAFPDFGHATVISRCAAWRRFFSWWLSC